MFTLQNSFFIYRCNLELRLLKCPRIFFTVSTAQMCLCCKMDNLKDFILEVTSYIVHQSSSSLAQAIVHIQKRRKENRTERPHARVFKGRVPTSVVWGPS
jgi:hypothetical protein